MDRPCTCIIILDKQYNIAYSSFHFWSYGPVRHQKNIIWTSEAVYGPVRHQKNIIWTSEAVYGPVRHQKNIIWTEASEVHIIFFW